jgi:hypothetical protein
MSTIQPYPKTLQFTPYIHSFFRTSILILSSQLRLGLPNMFHIALKSPCVQQGPPISYHFNNTPSDILIMQLHSSNYSTFFFSPNIPQHFVSSIFIPWLNRFPVLSLIVTVTLLLPCSILQWTFLAETPDVLSYKYDSISCCFGRSKKSGQVRNLLSQMTAFVLVTVLQWRIISVTLSPQEGERPLLFTTAYSV